MTCTFDPDGANHCPPAESTASSPPCNSALMHATSSSTSHINVFDCINAHSTIHSHPLNQILPPLRLHPLPPALPLPLLLHSLPHPLLVCALSRYCAST